MARILVLMGPQGAGKGTQAQMLANAFGLPIIATGDLLRELATADTELGHQVRDVQASGNLVSDDILAEVVRDRLGRDCNRGCLLDGFPRTLPQAHLLEEIARSLGKEISVVTIDVPRELLFRRLAGRRTCTRCGSVYHIEFKPSRVEGVCDLDGAPLFRRSDDNEEAIAQRLALYDEKTRPLLDFYARSGRLSEADGTGTPGEVFERIQRLIATEATADRG
jgi:adenylate kinase